MDNGYVYVLMNPAMENLVKIGKTERTPEERAKELSSTTGVPTPFIVVYKRYFESCSKAEEFVHTFLENKGFRISSNREFFEIPINEAIDAVIMANNHFGSFERKGDSLSNVGEEGVFTEDISDDLEFESTVQYVEPWKEMYRIAITFHYGFSDEIQDYEEAMKYYLKAIKLGSLDAYANVGTMYAKGEGVQVNNNMALQYFKEGAKKGKISCYSEMAKLFNEQDNIENSKKCWKRYFEQSKEIEASEAVDYMIEFCKPNDLPIENIEKLRSVQSNIIEYVLSNIEHTRSTLSGDFQDDVVSMYQEELEYIQLHFNSTTMD